MKSFRLFVGIALLALVEAAFAVFTVPLFAWQLDVTGVVNARRPKVAIVIDDLGYSYYSGKRCIELPADVTLSIIPFTPHGRRLAEAANQAGKEVMLHAPMETLHQAVWEPSLDRSMDHHQILTNFGAMLQSVPHVKGVNNHGGSLFTQDRQRMSWLLSVLGASDLYFVDSRTTSKSQGLDVALELEIPAAKRDLFIDNKRTREAITGQIQKLRNMAFQRGKVLAIAHPHGETLDVFAEQIPLLMSEGIRFVSVSDYLNSNSNYSLSAIDL